MLHHTLITAKSNGGRNRGAESTVGFESRRWLQSYFEIRDYSAAHEIRAKSRTRHFVRTAAS